MGIPITFLIIAPLAAVIALQLTLPFSRAAIVLSLIFSVCGLVLLYRCLLHPLRVLVSGISKPRRGEMPPMPAACDIVRALGDSLNARVAALQHDLDEVRDSAEKLRQEIQELREKRAVAVQAQQTVLDTLRKTQTGLDALAASAATEEPTMECALRKQQLADFSTALHRSECLLLHSGEFLDSGGGDDEGAEQKLPEAFPWKAKYNTNIPAVDGQHKLLLSYINKLHRGMQKGCDKKMLLEVLDDLTGYAFTHFATEEIFFTRTAYPLTGRHIEEHQKFRKTVTQLRDAVLDDKAFIDIALLEYLKGWLVEHIQRMDAGFVPYVTGTEPSPEQ